MFTVFENPAVFLSRIRYYHRDKAAYKKICHYKLICWLASAQNIVKQKSYFVKRGFVRMKFESVFNRRVLHFTIVAQPHFILERGILLGMVSL